MGYHAPHAEDVYRYVFRLDRHSERTLSDGFSWSILFVNDSSSECREFLLRYGAELCYRTADRIRFVFFSGLDPSETEELAQEANYRGGGLLSRVIAAAAGWALPRSRYDWERDSWERFRPDAFHPLDSHDRIERRVSFECDLYSAMPGSKEALRFAQRLGIGRFVPCFLMFSDIGTPAVRLLPFGRLTPAQAFERLRYWIDSFYEINSALLTHWEQVEASVVQACRRFEAPVEKVEQWRREGATNWQVLQRLSRYLFKLMRASPSSQLLRDIRKDWVLPGQIRELIGSYLNQLDSLELQVVTAADVNRTIDNLLRAPTDADLILRELAGIQQRHRTNLPEGLGALIDSAIRSFTNSYVPSSPEQQLCQWWRSEHGRPPSRNRYAKHRHAWTHYSIAKYGENAVGKVGEILKEEFAVIQRTILAQSITCEPEHAADEVVAALAAHLSVDPEDSEWRDSVSPYRQVLSSYFAQLQAHAPQWLMDIGIRSTPLTLADCVPSVEQRQQTRQRDLAATLPLLNTLLQQVEAEWTAHGRAMEEARSAEQQRVLGRIAERTRQWSASVALVDADKQSAWLVLISSLSRTREEMEERIFANSKEMVHASYPSEVPTRAAAAHLMKVLDEYESAVASLCLPYERDPDVLKVALDVSPIEASGIAADVSPIRVQEPVKSKIIAAVRSCEASVEHWPSVRREGIAWSPGGALCSALSQIVSKERLGDLLTVIGAKSLDEAPNVLSSRSQTVRLLDELNIHELLGVERILDEGNPKQDKAAISKQELYEAVFVAIGLIPNSNDEVVPAASPISQAAADRLREKVTSGAFDVFLAHNSQDKLAVQRLGHQLRAKGIYPWIDIEQIPPGRWFQDVIQSAVRKVKAAALVLGNSGVGRWQAVELRAFVSRCVEHGIPLIPVLLPGTANIPDELPFLRELNFVAFSQDVNEEEGISRLIWGITGQKPSIG